MRTRLFRARALLRQALDRDMDAARSGVFGFDGARCDRIVAAVLARLYAGNAGARDAHPTCSGTQRLHGACS